MLATFQQGPQPGDVVEARYVIRERIGQGGMGCVFLAEQPALERSVAIKFLQPELVDNPDLARRIHQEAVLACRVRDPHCVAVLDQGALPDGTPYLVMEYVPGRPLGRILADEPVPLMRAIDLFGQVLAAIAATHRSGIFHGDVKTDNFLVEAIDGADHVTLIDFGLAQMIGAPSRTDLEQGEIVVSGTPDYMAPEVIGGEPPSPASDLYGAGVILYELLTGTTPFGGGTAMEIMLRHARDEVMPPSQRRPDRGIPSVLDGVVLKALEKRPDARFRDAVAFARELRGAAQAAASWPRSMALGDASPTAPADVAAAIPPWLPAHGSDCSGACHTTKVELPRRAIADALRCGDVAAIADGYLRLEEVAYRKRIGPQVAVLGPRSDHTSALCEARHQLSCRDHAQNLHEKRISGGNATGAARSASRCLVSLDVVVNDASQTMVSSRVSGANSSCGANARRARPWACE